MNTLLDRIDIRPARFDEAQALEDFIVSIDGEKNRSLANSYITCAFSDDFRRPTYLIACLNNKIIGAASFSEELFTVNCWGISWVCVDEKYQNQGIGQKIVESALEHIRRAANKKVSVILATYPGKTRLYEKCGFGFAGYDYEGGSFMTKVVGN